MGIDQNIFLYWHDDVVPASVQRVSENWTVTASDWSVELYSRGRAIEFLQQQFGADTSAAFETCRIPAMQADVFRVLVVLALGGLYSDLTYEPRSAPGFVSQKHELTGVKSWQGQFTNSVFYGQKKCPTLGKVAEEILDGVRGKNSTKIWSLTGPGAWFRAIAPHNNPEVQLLSLPEMMGSWLLQSQYSSSTRGTSDHWSERQKCEDIFFSQSDR